MELRESLLTGSFLWLRYVRLQQKNNEHNGKLHSTKALRQI